MKKDQDGFINFDADPVISDAIGAGRQRSAARKMTPAQRRKAERDHARNRMNLDIPEDLSKTLETLAEELHVSISSLAVYLMDRALEGIDMDALREAREPIRAMRFEFVLPHKKVKKNRLERNR